MLSIGISGKRFVTTGNPHGVSGADTVFEYHVDGDQIRGTYAGGRVVTGYVVGKVTGADTIATLYQCITTEGELMAGWGRGRVSRNDDGLVELFFEWAWFTGDQSGGTSAYVEIQR